MILVTHALVGAALGSKIKNPLILIPLALATHYFLDGLRHGEYLDDRTMKLRNSWWKVALDILAALLIIFAFSYFHGFNAKLSFNVLLGSFFSTLPDLFTVFFYWKPNTKILIHLKNFGTLMHKYKKNPKYSPERKWTLRNATNDILISIVSIIFLFI